MELEYKEAIEIPEGKHSGEIRKIEYRTTEEGYNYTDIYFSVDGIPEITLKYGCPTNLSANSKLGKLLQKFMELKTGEKYDIEKILVGEKVEYLTMNEIKKEGTFATVIDNSIKPTTEQKVIVEKKFVK